ncbi:hypothetical protein C8R44DRAFT_866152 [Mycena epipterygia]|nr:hypothetical protein C8R44DRAFT_866152 [Mycena epipterygia]
MSQLNPPAGVSLIEDHLQVLRDSSQVPVPYTGGVHPVKPEDLVVYYGVEGEKSASRIDLGRATEENLAELASACEQATFGVDQTDVLDESYRKAGKLDLTEFAARLDVVASGLVDAITPDILQGQDADGRKALRAEMYKLNVNGPGSFFKAHKDTPRGNTMIGSLVVVFPTVHTGGSLLLKHDGATWTFDSAAQLLAVPAPPSALAYVAFYSDVTHAVEPVLTGHRVTITYNLFVLDRSQPVPGPNRIVPAPERAPAFLPAGGFLAYGLAHQYPMPTPPKSEWVDGKRVKPPSRLGPILRLLKGSDARIRTVSERVGLETHVKILYDTGEKYSYDNDVLADDVLNTEDVNESYPMSLKDEIERRGEVVEQREERAEELRVQREKLKTQREEWNARCGLEYYEAKEAAEAETPKAAAVPVHWVTKITELNRVGSQYIAYGNDASIKHVYGNAALFVQVPALGDGIRA